MDKISRMIMFLTFCLLVTSSLESPLAAQTRRMTARKRAAQDNVLLASRLIAENKHEQAYGILNDVIENLDKKNAQAYYYLALICTESEKFRDAEKAKSFISQAEENGLDYVELGLKPIGGLKTVKVTVLEPNAETSSDTLAGPQAQAKTQAILEPSKPTASDTSVARKEEKPELAAVPPAKTVAEPVEQEPVEATAVPPEAAGAEHGSSGLPAVAAPLPTQSVVKTLPLPEVSSRPAKAVSEPAPPRVEEPVRSSIPAQNVEPAVDTPPVLPTPETTVPQTLPAPGVQAALPTQLIRWGANLPMKGFIYDVRSEMGRIITKESLGQQLTYNESSTKLNLRTELNEARHEMLLDRYLKANEILRIALRRDEYWWETNYLLSIVLNRDPDQGGDRRLAVIHGKRVKEYLKSAFPSDLDPCPDQLLSPRQLFEQYLGRARQFYAARQYLLAENQLNYALGIEPDENFSETDNLNDDDLAGVQFFWGQVAQDLGDYKFASQRFIDARTIQAAYRDTVDNWILPNLESLIEINSEVQPIEVTVQAPDQPPVRSANSARLSFSVSGLPDLRVAVSEPQNPRANKSEIKIGESYTIYGPITYKADLNIKRHKRHMVYGILISAVVLVGVTSF